MNPHDREDLLRLVSTLEALELRDAAQLQARQQLLEKLRRYLREAPPSGRSTPPPASPAGPAATADGMTWPIMPL